MTDNEFGKFIKEKRKSLGLTSVELAESAGISQSYLSQIENGKRGIPTDEILFRLATILKIDSAKLLKMAGRSTSSFDENIRHFVNLLCSDHPFEGRIQGSLWKFLDSIWDKYKLTSHSIQASNDKKQLADQVSSLIIGIDSSPIKWEILKGLQRLAHEYGLWFNPSESSSDTLPEVDLYNILENDILYYKDHLLKKNEIKLLKLFLDTLLNKEE